MKKTLISTLLTTAATDETSLYAADELPELDFKGETIKISVIENGTHARITDFYVEEATGDLIDDSVHAANNAVMERLNVKIEYVQADYPSWNYRADYYKSIEQSIMTDDGSFDIIVNNQGGSYFFVNGYLQNLSDIPYIDFDKPWWAQGMLEQVEFNGVIPYVTGDYSLGKTKNMMCMFFNSRIAEENKLGNLYEIVTNGEWTLDKMRELTSAVYRDLNGNTEVDEDDLLGLVFQGGNQYMGFLDSLAMEVVERSGASMSFTFDNEHNVNAIQKLIGIIESTSGIIEFGSDQMLAEESLFIRGNTLFTGGWLRAADNYRDLDFEYGILPYPKYDENQESYGTTYLTQYMNFMIPVTNTDKLELAGAALEALSSQYYRTVTPAYFETTLKVKYSNDNDMSQMFDLIRESSGFNFAQTFCESLGYIADNIKVAVMNKNSDWVSLMATKKSTAESNIEKIADAYAQMAD